MKRVLTLAVLTAVLLCLTSCKKDVQTINSNVSETESSLADTSDLNYSTEPETLLGTWKIAFCSEDNIEYQEYYEHHSHFGYFTFFEDGTAVIQYSENDINIYQYETSKKHGSISFYNIDSGAVEDFHFGYGTVCDKKNKKLIISKYNLTDKSTTYYIALWQAAN